MGLKKIPRVSKVCFKTFFQQKLSSPLSKLFKSQQVAKTSSQTLSKFPLEKKFRNCAEFSR